MVTYSRALLTTGTLALLLLGGCGGYDNEEKNVVGSNLVLTQETFQPVVDLSREALQAGFDQAAAAGGGTTPLTAILGIKSYKIDYWTEDIDGKPIKASGLITIPDITPEFMQNYAATHNGSNFSLSIVSDQHGTIFTDAEAPSVAAETTHRPNQLAALFSGAALFMTVQPDYPGYGDSNVTHPFVLEKPLANATADMIDAAIAFANRAGLPINGQIFLSGYSEGGYATLAAAKEIQQNRPDLHVMAVAPMAGPYDLEKLGLGVISQPALAFPPFLAYAVYAYANAYEDVDINKILQPQYVSLLPTLFDGEHNATFAYMALPNVVTGGADGQSPDKLFLPSFMQNYANDRDEPLRRHFRENSPIDWKPQMPVKLLHCTNDDIIPYAMTQIAKAAFDAQGATTVEVEAIEGITADPAKHESVHGNCAPAAYAKVVPWFDAIRQGKGAQ